VKSIEMFSNLESSKGIQPQIYAKKTIKLMSWNPQKSPGWGPSQDMVRAMSARAIKNDHHLERIDHSCGKLLGQLTFVFSGEMLSPPKGTYDKEPNIQEVLPKGVHIGCMKFGKFEWSSQKGKEY